MQVIFWQLIESLIKVSINWLIFRPLIKKFDQLKMSSEIRSTDPLSFKQAFSFAWIKIFFNPSVFLFSSEVLHSRQNEKREGRKGERLMGRLNVLLMKERKKGERLMGRKSCWWSAHFIQGNLVEQQVAESVSWKMVSIVRFDYHCFEWSSNIRKNCSKNKVVKHPYLIKKLIGA